MNKKKVVILIILFVVTTIFFQMAFLFDSGKEKVEITHESHKRGLWLFFAVIGLSYLPCFLMGYGRFNPLLGFLPPLLLVGLFWGLLIYRFNQADINILNMEKYLPRTAIMMTVITSFFGILIASLSSRIFDSWSKGGEQRMEEKPAKTQEDDSKNKTENQADIKTEIQPQETSDSDDTEPEEIPDKSHGDGNRTGKKETEKP